MQINTGPKGSGIAGEALAAYRAIKFNTATPAVLVYADAGDRPVGFTQEAFASGDEVTFIRPHGSWLWEGSGVLANGDLVMCANDGVAVVETSATTPTAFTVCQVRVARAATAPSEMEKV